MEEVEGPLVHGVYNYSLLRGETGPLVYPGGFVYLYGAIRWLTHAGSDVRPAQLAMAACYVTTLGACIACHAIARPRGVPPWALLLVSVSLRLHSIYVLCYAENTGMALTSAAQAADSPRLDQSLGRDLAPIEASGVSAGRSPSRLAFNTGAAAVQRWLGHARLLACGARLPQGSMEAG